MVRADSGQLLHVFLQLISNAVDALEETQGGTFDITLRPSGSNLILEFADSGPGIKEPQRVFEPFYTTKPVGKGTGLGLSTCYGIIQQHNGEISCRNRPEGGAIFLVSLPVVHCHPFPETRPTGRRLASRKVPGEISFRAQKIYFALATLILLVHLVVAAVAKPSFPLTIYGDANPCALLILAILAARENFRRSAGVLPLFWKLFAAGLAILSEFAGLLVLLRLASAQFRAKPHYRRHPVSARARIFSFGAGASSTFRGGWPQSANSFPRFDSAEPMVVFALWLFQPALASRTSGFFPIHAVLLYARADPTSGDHHRSSSVLCVRNPGSLARFYLQLLVAFVSLAGGNLLLNVAIESNKYYAGSFYDTPFLFAIYLFMPIAAFGPTSQPRPDGRPNRELIQSVWTARFAMLGILSLPVIALIGLYEKNLPPEVATFRLTVGFWRHAASGCAGLLEI